MKKVLVFALVLSLVLGSFSFAFAADFSDTEDLACASQVDVLTALGVVNGYPDGTFKPEGVVTRAEMAKMLVIALGLDAYVKTAKSTFTDCVGHWADGYVAYAESKGIIQGYGGGLFGPDDPVTYDQALTMIVRALGYTDDATELVGIWPAAHVSLAQALGITEDLALAGEQGADRGDVAIMLYNALSVPMVYIDKEGVTQDVTTADDTFLELLGADALDAEVITPLTEVDTDLSAYYGFYGVPYEFGDDIIAVGDVEGTAYEVNLLVDDVNDVVSFEYNDKTYEVLEVANTGTVTVPDYNFAAWVNDSNTVYAATDSVYTTVNAAGLVDDSTATIVVDGNLSLSGTDLFSINQWVVDGAKVVDEDVLVNIEDGEADIFGNGMEMAQDADADDAYIVTVDGAADDITALEDGDVAFLYADNAGDVVRMTIARDVIEGTITKVNSTDDGTKFTVDGTAYSLSDYDTVALAGSDYDIGGLDNTAVSEVWALTLDPDGKIFLAEEVGESLGDYAVVVDFVAEADRYGTITHYLKVVTKDGEALELVVKNDADLYDVNLAAALAADREPVAMTTNFPLTAATIANPITGIVAGDIVAYGTNSDGKVTEIEKYAQDNNTIGVATDPTMTKKGVYDGDIADASTVVFTFGGTWPTWSTDEDDYDVSDFATIAGEDFEARVIKNNDGDIVAMIVPDGVAGTSIDTFGVINSYNYISNVDDDRVVEYTGIANGADVVLEADSDDNAYRVVSTTAAGVALFAFEKDGAGIVTEAIKIDTTMNATDDGYGLLTGTWAEVASIDKALGLIDAGGYVAIGEDVEVYKMIFDDGDFDGYALGSMSNVAAGARVLLFDITDDDEDTADIILVVTRADYAKYGNGGSVANILGF